MSRSERVLVSHRGAAWLPVGGSADVVLAGVPPVVPSPICLVRLLVTRGTAILTEARPDGRGLDIPTRKADDGRWEESLKDLLGRTVGTDGRPGLLGYVRNRVAGAPEGYPWPSPYAHFAVWHCTVAERADAPGTWLDAAAAEAELQDRHWWPLAAHALLPDRAGVAPTARRF